MWKREWGRQTRDEIELEREGRRDNRSGGEGDGEDAQQGGGGANTMVAARNSMHGMLATIWMAL